MYLLVNIIILALCANFILMIAIKWRLVEYLQVHGTRLISELANCHFCLSFWTCLLLAIGQAILTNDLTALIMAIPATPLCRRLL